MPGDGRDVRDTVGAGDAEFWKQQWDNYEDDNAVADVDVRGWIYSPHQGQMSRKQRLFINLARQLIGIGAAPTGSPSSQSPSPRASREPSPNHMSMRETAQMRAAQREGSLTAREAEEILRRGEREAEFAAKGEYSEGGGPSDSERSESYPHRNSGSPPSTDTPGNGRPHHLSPAPSTSSLKREDNIRTGIQKRASWNQPANMSAIELREANSHLMARLQHFLAIPMANIPISVFFYNDELSRQRTVYTNPSGHFNLRAALDFVPTHVRILASDKLSVTEEVMITEPKGISVISDIDDTIKHSAISSGAREIFRNAFIRELGDLTIEGVKEWYGKMAEMGVKFHYVSNSPWQIYPVISKFFALAGLPPGSFHLKQYSGMLQGIFEPVAERKKSTLDKLARDFPERSFILIGDSGEADLEVYTDFVLENPGRVLAVFIRDVTTPVGGGFFDPSIGPMSNTSSPSRRGEAGSSEATTSSKADSTDDDPELRAAIEASIRDMEEENRKRSFNLSSKHDKDDHPESRPKLPPRRTPQSSSGSEESINSSRTEEPDPQLGLRRVATDSETFGHRDSVASIATTRSTPPIPRKPQSLRGASGTGTTSSRAPPPPKPRRSSANVQPGGSTTSTQTSNVNASVPRTQQTYAAMAREKLSSAYQNMPAPSSYLTNRHAPSSQSDANRSLSSVTSNTGTSNKVAPPPPPPRRGISAYPVAAAAYAGSKVSSAWNAAPALPYRSNRPDGSQINAFSTTSSTSLPQNSDAPLGLNGGPGASGPVPNKREQLWMQRWARAEQVLGDKGVILKSWRVGTDVLEFSEKLIKEYEEKQKKGEQSRGSSNGNGGWGRNGNGNGNGNGFGGKNG